MITLVAEGKLIVDLPMARMAIGVLRSLDKRKQEVNSDRIALLTEQERKVLILIAQYNSNAEIAKALFTTENTIKVHVRNIMHKLSAHSRLELIACAVEE